MLQLFHIFYTTSGIVQKQDLIKIPKTGHKLRKVWHKTCFSDWSYKAVCSSVRVIHDSINRVPMYDFIRGLLNLVAADSKTNLAASLIESENLSYFYRIGPFGGWEKKLCGLLLKMSPCLICSKGSDCIVNSYWSVSHICATQKKIGYIQQGQLFFNMFNFNEHRLKNYLKLAQLH